MIWNVLELVLDENVIYVCFNLCCLVVWLVGCLIHWLAGWLVGWLLGWLLDCLVSGLAGWLHSKDANPRITNPIVSQVWYPFGDPHGTLPHTPAWQSFLTMPNFALLNMPGAMLRKWGESASTCPDCWSSSSWSWAKATLISSLLTAAMQTGDAQISIFSNGFGTHAN